jgi:hypothetical protein
MNLLIAYSLTLAIETAMLLHLFRKQDWRLVAAASVFASTLTFGIFWLALMPVYNATPLTIVPFSFQLAVLAYEAFAVAAEAAIYRKIFEKCGWKEAFKRSLAANAASFLTGIALGFAI